MASRRLGRPRPGQGASLLLVAAILVASCGPRVTILDRADEAFAAEEWIRAESLYQRALRDNGTVSHARTRLAWLAAREARQVWLRDEDVGAARSLVRKSLDLDSACALAHLTSIRIDLNEERITPQRAVDQLSELSRKSPADAELRLVLGQVLLDLERAPAAVEHFHHGSRAAPGDLRFPVLLAEALHALNPEEAQARMTALLSAHPGDLTVLTGAARLATRAGRFEHAGQLLGEAQRIAPRDHRIRQAQRRLERRRREWDVRLDEPAGGGR